MGESPGAFVFGRIWRRNLLVYVYIVYRFFSLIFEAVSIAMLIRAVLSWFPVVDDRSKFMQIIYGVTEFFISPVREILWKLFPKTQMFPLDLSFLLTYLLLKGLQTLLMYAYLAIA